MNYATTAILEFLEFTAPLLLLGYSRLFHSCRGEGRGPLGLVYKFATVRRNPIVGKHVHQIRYNRQQSDVIDLGLCKCCCGQDRRA